MNAGAMFDDTGKYRYLLWRTWDEGKRNPAVFIMLNPSTANAEDDDPTIRRCIGFAKDWGYTGLKVVNLFGLVSSDPKKLATETDPIGPENDYVILSRVPHAGIIIAAWGAFKEAKTRSIQVLNAVQSVSRSPIYCLGMSKDGSPKHPLYIRADTKPVLFYPNYSSDSQTDTTINHDAVCHDKT